MKPQYQVRRISRGYWTYDLYLGSKYSCAALYSVGEVHGDEKLARKKARAALIEELEKRKNG